MHVAETQVSGAGRAQGRKEVAGGGDPGGGAGPGQLGGWRGWGGLGEGLGEVLAQDSCGEVLAGGQTA